MSEPSAALLFEPGVDPASKLTVEQLEARLNTAPAATRGMPAGIVAVMDELIDGLARFSARVNRDVELTIDDAGGLCLMVGCEAGRGNATGFDEAERFETVDALWLYLEMGQLDPEVF